MTGLAAPDLIGAIGLTPPPPLVSVRGLSHAYGRGCPECADRTGAARGTSQCPVCQTVIGVRDASFEVGSGEVLGIVGESGSGKTTLLRILHLDLAPRSGEMHVDGQGDLFRSPTPRAELQRSTVVMVHQNALAAGLSVHLAAESNVAERLLATGDREFGAVRARARAQLTELGIAASRHSDPLHTFSGGMQQRVQLARALVSPPPVLLLDEPTTGLDPSVQAELLETIQRVTDQLGSATVVVSHDLDVVRVLADRIMVITCGEIVEEGVTGQVLSDPQHPYTQLLVSSVLR
ncbi:MULTISPECIES: ATP-binding cassette domain-containing protein [unclassified Modestobacter]